MFFRFLNCIIPARIQNLMRMRFFQQVFSRILSRIFIFAGIIIRFMICTVIGTFYHLCVSHNS